jgi:hypothetical protein
MSRRTNDERIREILAAKDEATKPATEALAQLYAAMLKLPEMQLSDGTTAKVEPFFAPEADKQGRMHCGIDLRLSNGDLLEFTLRNTGWEKSFIRDVENRRAGDGPACKL